MTPLSQRIKFLFTGRLSPTLLSPVPLEVSHAPQPITPPLNPDSGRMIEAYFSPRGGCAAACVREILKATVRLRVQAYQLTHAEIQAAILTVIKRGVPTEIILDKTQTQYDFGKQCQAAGANVYDDHTVKIAHNKVFLIEYTETVTKGRIGDAFPGVEDKPTFEASRRTLIQGSFNFSINADESNAENCVVHRTEQLPVLGQLFDAFSTHFETRKGASIVFGTEHPQKTLGLDFELESPEERNERLNG